MATITSNPELWVNTMLVEEHGLALDGPKPGISGIVTFAAFVGVGAVPLLPYLVPASRLFSTSVMVALVACGLGAVRIPDLRNVTSTRLPRDKNNHVVYGSRLDAPGLRRAVVTTDGVRRRSD